ncbi:restriction endonuclease subunit S [Alistipes onderdonkii]|jgi:restriction endonuclease, S subunit|uniref:restriction endonuclease subunit S n=1 Tax=Alistipes onderdonkii TaxID=328813 RepID=UPI00210B1C2D|nr:restriction endonuclease subunit S [Alistipes onderdonkii]MCQ4880507.1 restriction endonuclease subunit S [Alistipes onderdonkii]
MATNTDIPQGYKATALGIIPQEWKTIRLKDCFSISAGGDVQKDCFSEAPSLQYKYPIYSNSLFNHGLYGFTSHPRHKANSITITGRGALGHAEYREIDFDAIVRLLVLAPKIPLNGQYITEYINFRKPFFYESTGVPQLTAPQIANIQVLFPPLGEQRKIAEVLGVWDEAIEKQARLIEKLALRKRGLMQRLLSAKLRLPGFSEPWKIHKLQELFTERNETNRTDLPLLSITGDRGVILQTESEKRDTSNDDKSKYKRIAKGDIGYNTMRMWQGRSALSGLEGIVSPAYTIVVPNTDVDGYYMSVLFKQPRLIYDFWTHSQGLVGDTLNCKYRDFGQVHICCPPLAEQKAITEVLTAADREIELAKEKLERLRRQKRGLMQQLLSGKKRVKINI